MILSYLSNSLAGVAFLGHIVRGDFGLTTEGNAYRVDTNGGLEFDVDRYVSYHCDQHGDVGKVSGY